MRYEGKQMVETLMGVAAEARVVPTDDFERDLFRQLIQARVEDVTFGVATRIPLHPEKMEFVDGRFHVTDEWSEDGTLKVWVLAPNPCAADPTDLLEGEKQTELRVSIVRHNDRAEVVWVHPRTGRSNSFPYCPVLTLDDFEG